MRRFAGNACGGAGLRAARECELGTGCDGTRRGLRRSGLRPRLLVWPALKAATVEDAALDDFFRPALQVAQDGARLDAARLP